MSLAELSLTQLYIMRDDRVPDRDRLEASKEILSRRFGPPKAVTEAVGSIPTGLCVEGLDKPICNSGCGAGGAFAGAVFGSRFSTGGRAAIVRSRGWSGWYPIIWRGL
jgi:hypothetical protein